LHYAIGMSIQGQTQKYSLRAHRVRFCPDSGLSSDIAPCPKSCQKQTSAHETVAIKAVIVKLQTLRFAGSKFWPFSCVVGYAQKQAPRLLSGHIFVVLKAWRRRW
jgi:hypothetical protein